MYSKERRIKLEKGEQSKLIASLADKYGSVKKIADNWNLSYSTLKKYSQEIFLLPENIFNKIIYELEINKGKLTFSYLDYNWGAKIGGKNGIIALWKKYPNKIREWRKLAGANSGASRIKKISLPNMDEILAEIVGVYLGAGSLTTYFIKIIGDVRYDLPYFDYLNKLVIGLFGVNGKIYRDKRSNAISLVFFSKKLCSFFTDELKLKLGDKIRNQSSIPQIILADFNLSIACLRGLIDTDGSISRRGRNGEQFTVTFSNYNKTLLNQVKSISDKNSLFTFFSDKEMCIGTNAGSKIIQYFKVVGSSNLKHIVRFYERFYNNNTIYQKEVKNYYQQPFYRDVNLPFKLA
ncbi:MAG: LAGLIDADG family homing endonuclease [Nanoarchaeota archaeon]